MGDKSQSCMCSRRRQKLLVSKRRERCKRLRQTLVCEQEEEFHHEPYLRFLHDEFSPESSECGSDIELPWKEFAISDAELAKMERSADPEEKQAAVEDVEVEPVKKISSGKIHLPWEELIVTDTVQSELARKKINQCDSALEIPWEDILYDFDMKIKVSDEALKKCEKGTVEIPWQDLLIPDNIVFSARKKYPFSTKVQQKSKKCGCSRPKHKSLF